jgi:hypothetical protein
MESLRYHALFFLGFFAYTPYIKAQAGDNNIFVLSTIAEIQRSKNNMSEQKYKITRWSKRSGQNKLKTARQESVWIGVERHGSSFVEPNKNLFCFEQTHMKNR